MSGNRTVPIALEEFVVSGKFGGIYVGMGAEDLSSTFPAPDDKSVCGKIWRYVNIELHCPEDRLEMIFSDYIGSLAGGGSLNLDPWVFNQNPAVTLDEFARLLNTRRLDHSVRFNNFLDEAVVLIKASGVKCIFNLDRERSDGQFFVSAFLQKLRSAA